MVHDASGNEAVTYPSLFLFCLFLFSYFYFYYFFGIYLCYCGLLVVVNNWSIGFRPLIIVVRTYRDYKGYVGWIIFAILEMSLGVLVVNGGCMVVFFFSWFRGREEGCVSLCFYACLGCLIEEGQWAVDRDDYTGIVAWL